MSPVPGVSPPKSTKLIALMGATGSGKSSMINAIVGKDVAEVGHSLESATAEVQQYTFSYRGAEIRIIDTPGFNDFREEGSLSDLDILNMIAAFMHKEYEDDFKFSGIIYLHNISAPKVDRMGIRNMNVFKGLCGADFMKNVVIATTCWDLVEKGEGEDNETELQEGEGLLKDFLDGGATFVRTGHFESGALPDGGSFFTPHQVLDHVLSLDPSFVQMQEEMAHVPCVAETTAGGELKEEYLQIINQLRAEITMLKSATDEERSHLQVQSDALKNQLETWEKRSQELKETMELYGVRKDQVTMKAEFEECQRRHSQNFDNLHQHVSELRRASLDFSQRQSWLEERNTELSASLERAQRERDTLTEDCRDLRTKNESLVERLVSLALTPEADSGQKQLETGNVQITKRMERLAAESTQAREEAKVAQQRSKDLERELKELRSLLDAANAKNIVTSNELEAAQRQLQTLRGDRNRLVEELAAARATNTASESEIARLREDNNAQSHQIWEHEATIRELRVALNRAGATTVLFPAIHEEPQTFSGNGLAIPPTNPPPRPQGQPPPLPRRPVPKQENAYPPFVSPQTRQRFTSMGSGARARSCTPPLRRAAMPEPMHFTGGPNPPAIGMNDAGYPTASMNNHNAGSQNHHNRQPGPYYHN
ncbi:hypothetical protein CC1G_12342 [Coprinopsis cinerea okayama7|uniref:AIG1-type G domain-containing protein n=1 Tax=Coprinopsis cinerea (strain Okayama-7 / 130 / ATCC MYA-4618 / FGSC 9003) TaxID=240176 RepID=A8NJN0_COPC7|nr:hypothetical protein CC1G_12342 [Coprinopsis cinerea okayama7\|eukprot:XP_001834263.2 hypothetical protein CC1G_12342 [Coprinopsis cinerea okayama7\